MPHNCEAHPCCNWLLRSNFEKVVWRFWGMYCMCLMLQSDHRKAIIENKWVIYNRWEGKEKTSKQSLKILFRATLSATWPIANGQWASVNSVILLHILESSIIDIKVTVNWCFKSLIPCQGLQALIVLGDEFYKDVLLSQLR